MKRSSLIIASVLTLGIGFAGLAFAHGTANARDSYFGHMGGMMGGHSMAMGMNFSHDMFDLDQLSAELNLSNEQIAILSQLESSHIQMQTIMHEQFDEETDFFGHHQMMSVMSENLELMNSHFSLFEDFEESMSDEQKQQWTQYQGYCH